MSGPTSPTDLTLLALQRLEQEIDDARWQELLHRHGQALEDRYQEHARISQALAGLPRPSADRERPATILAAIPWRAQAPPRRFWSAARLTASALVAACVAVLIVLDHAFTEPPTPPAAVHQFTAMAEHAPAEVADLPHGIVASAPEPVATTQVATAQRAASVDDALAQRRFGTAASAPGSAPVGAKDQPAVAGQELDEQPDARLPHVQPSLGAAAAADSAAAAAPHSALAANDRTQELRYGKDRSEEQKATADDASAAPVASAMAPAPGTARTMDSEAAAPPATTTPPLAVAGENRLQAPRPEGSILYANAIHAAAAEPALWSCALTLSRSPDLTAVVTIATTQAAILPRGALILVGNDAQGRVIWHSSAIIPPAALSLESPQLRVRQVVTIPADGLPEGLQSFQARIPGATSPSVALSTATASSAPAATPSASPGH